MSSRAPDLRRNVLRGIIPDPPANALAPAAQDTRYAPPPVTGAPPPVTGALPPMGTIGAAPELNWFAGLVERGGRWARKQGVPSAREFPPIKLLYAVLGENPLENVEAGPGQAIASFARRNPRIMRYFADPGFENFLLKHGPYTPGSALSNAPVKLRDYAPEAVVEDLWQKYQKTPEARRMSARAERRAKQAMGGVLGRRSTDAPRNVAAPLAAQR